MASISTASYLKMPNLFSGAMNERVSFVSPHEYVGSEDTRPSFVHEEIHNTHIASRQNSAQKSCKSFATPGNGLESLPPTLASSKIATDQTVAGTEYEELLTAPARTQASPDTSHKIPVVGKNADVPPYDTTGHEPSDRFFDSLKKSHAILDYSLRKQDRAKIAVLCSGIDGTHPAIAQDKRIKSYRSWVEPLADRKSKTSGFQEAVLRDLCVDQSGHGTHTAAVLLRVDPLASLYVARGAEGSEPRPEDVEEVSSHVIWAAWQQMLTIPQAINVAANDWSVDIISLSFGFEKDHDGIDTAIRRATDGGVIVFAAASDNGISKATTGILFPARHSDVICVNSSDFYGTPSIFNPSPIVTPDYFTTMGARVLSAWNNRKSDNQGTSLHPRVHPRSNFSILPIKAPSTSRLHPHQILPSTLDFPDPFHQVFY